MKYKLNSAPYWVMIWYSYPEEEEYTASFFCIKDTKHVNIIESLETNEAEKTKILLDIESYGSPSLI